MTNLGAIGLVLLCLHPLAFAQNTNPPAPSTQTNTSKRLHVWWRDSAPGQRPYTVNNQQMPLISVKGNKFVDPSGNTMLLRGLSISDPDKLEGQGHWSKDHFVKAKEMGTKLVRIPIHPVAWRERTPAEYIKLLDQAVGWCTELEMYVILDWHTIGNLETEVFQDPMYETTKQETYLESKGISWTVWCFDPEWGPTLIRNWNYELNPSGEFVKAAMNGEIK